MARRAVPAALFLLAAAPRVFAAEIRVPRDFATIQEALDAAAAGDTVLVEPGEHVISEPIRFKKDLVLRSEGGAEETTVRFGIEPAISPLVAFQSGETSASVLEGFRLSGGQGVEIVAGSSPSIKGCIITGARWRG